MITESAVRRLSAAAVAAAVLLSAAGNTSACAADTQMILRGAQAVSGANAQMLSRGEQATKEAVASYVRSCRIAAIERKEAEKRAHKEAILRARLFVQLLSDGISLSDNAGVYYVCDNGYDYVAAEEGGAMYVYLVCITRSGEYFLTSDTVNEAVRARVGEIGIIPGSQGTKSYIVEGLGNPDSFESSSHGAGRVMSRTAAINELSLEDEVARLDAQGIVHAIRCQKDLEEAPGAYKDIDEVMANQKDLVKVVTSLSPVAVVKGL